MSERVYCQIHRYGDKIAVYVGGRTTYMSKVEAETFARALQERAANVPLIPFGEDPLPTFSFEIDGEKS